MNNKERRYLLICNTSDGLVAQLNGVVVQLQFAQRMGLEPIIYLHERSYLFGGPNPYYDEGHGPNVWDYFYKPVGESGEALAALVEQGRVYTLSGASELNRLYRWEPRSWFMNPYGYFRSVENTADGDYPFDWWQVQRECARTFINDGTLQINSAIVDQVDRFVDEHFSEETLGLQLRGSDKFDFGTGPNLSRKVLPEEYYPHIDKYLAEHPKCKFIFVATDQRQWLKDLEAAYPGKILSFSEWSLSDSEENNFHLSQQKATRGVEVVVDLLLLSRCSYVVKCHAAVGEMALTLNPGIEFLDLNYETQPYEVKSRMLRAIVAPCIKLLGYVWRVLSENGMALSKVVSIDGGRVLVGNQKRPHELNTKTSHAGKAPLPPVFSRRFVSSGFNRLLEVLAKYCFTYKPRD
jgi:hypothetical protein